MGKYPILYTETGRRSIFLKLNLKAVRVNAGFSQCELAILMGVGKSTISRWENGDTPISKDNLLKLCLFCNTNINDVQMPEKERSFHGTENKKSML